MAEILDTYIKSPSPPKDPDAQYVYNEQQFSKIEGALKKHHDKILDTSANSTALYENEVTVRAAADSAIVQSVETLRATVESNNTSTQGQIQNIQSAQADANSSTATKLTTLEAKVDAGDASNLAKINAEAKARVTKDEALASQVNALQAALKTSNANLLSTIQTEQKVRSTAVETEAVARQTLSSYVGFTEGTTYSATITEMLGTKAAADGVSYNWAVQGKVGKGADGVTSGIRLTGMQKFNPDGTTTAYSKLIIDANTEINGNLVVNGTITGNKITNAGIDTPQLATNSVSSIAAGSAPFGLSSTSITGITGSSFLILASIDGTASVSASSVTLVISIVANGVTVGYYTSPVSTLGGITPVQTATGYISTSAAGFSATGPYSMWGFSGTGNILPRSMQAQYSVAANATHTIYCGVFNGSTNIAVPTSIAVWQFKK